MGIIAIIVVGFLILGCVITIFEKVTGLNITGEAKATSTEFIAEDEELSPMEIEIERIRSKSYDRARVIADYIIPELYEQPQVDISTTYMSIDEILRNYLKNQLLFSEKYEKHVIILRQKIRTIGKKGNQVYISVGDGSWYGLNNQSTEQAKNEIKCYLLKSLIDDDDDYKKEVLALQPGQTVTLVGILLTAPTSGFELHSTILVEADGTVPSPIYNWAISQIYEKYDYFDSMAS